MLHHVVKFSRYINSLSVSTDSDSCVSHQYHRKASNSVLLLDSKVLICIHLQQSGGARGETRASCYHSLIQLPHGSTHRRAPGTEWYSLPSSFIVPLHVCFSVFADHSPNRSIERGVCATSMNNFPRTRPISGSDEDSLRCEQTESLGHYLTSSMDTKETFPLLIRVFFCQFKVIL